MHKRVLLSGIVAGIVLLILQLVLGGMLQHLFPLLWQEYSNPALFRGMQDWQMQLWYIYPFLFAILLSWIWQTVKPFTRGKTPGHRGVRFGLIYWLIAMLPGLLLSYITFPLSLELVAFWGLQGLAQALLAGMIFAKMNR